LVFVSAVLLCDELVLCFPSDLPHESPKRYGDVQRHHSTDSDKDTRTQEEQDLVNKRYPARVVCAACHSLCQQKAFFSQQL
jgi:hypothetical protein